MRLHSISAVAICALGMVVAGTANAAPPDGLEQFGSQAELSAWLAALPPQEMQDEECLDPDLCPENTEVEEIVVVGSNLAGVTERGLLPVSVIEFPRIALLGIYPTMQGVAIQLLVVAVLVYRAGVRTDQFPPYLEGTASTGITRISGPWVAGAAGILLVAVLLLVQGVTDLLRRRP